MKYELELLSDGQADIYRERAKRAYNQMKPSFFDYSNIAIGALAEYMANLNGWTFYEHSQGRHYHNESA